MGVTVGCSPGSVGSPSESWSSPPSARTCAWFDSRGGAVATTSNDSVCVSPARTVPTFTESEGAPGGGSGPATGAESRSVPAGPVYDAFEGSRSAKTTFVASEPPTFVARSVYVMTEPTAGTPFTSWPDLSAHVSVVPAKLGPVPTAMRVGGAPVRGSIVGVDAVRPRARSCA